MPSHLRKFPACLQGKPPLGPFLEKSGVIAIVIDYTPVVLNGDKMIAKGRAGAV